MSELYYAEMEAVLNKAQDEYFKARLGHDSDFNRMLFGAGFERAFEMLWRHPSPSVGTVSHLGKNLMTNKVDVAVIDAQLTFLRIEVKRLDGLNTAWSQRAIVTFAGIIETLAALRRERQMTGMNGKPIDAEPAAPVAWMTKDGRVVNAESKRGAVGASAAALAPYSIPLYK